MSPKAKAKSKKQVPSSAPTSGKVPVSSPPLQDAQLRFRFGQLDHDKWALSKIERQHHKRLLDKLAYFEGMTTGQARANNLLVDYDMADCPNKAARQRLNHRYKGQDSISRLTIAPSESMRLMGFVEGNEFHIVWWDPNHEVWPEGKNRR